MFQRIFNKPKEEISPLRINSLMDIDQIDKIINLSDQRPVLIFKHSKRCGISNIVLKRFEGLIRNESDKINYFLLDIIKYRNISNLIEDKFQVQHQSPQLLVIDKGNVTAHYSHYGILDAKF